MHPKPVPCRRCVSLDLYAERDPDLGSAFGGHTLGLRLVLDPQEQVESRVFFSDPDYIVANCMAQATDAVTLWTRTGKADSAYEPVRPWTLRLSDMTGGVVFSALNPEHLDLLENHFRNEWFRTFRREWATRKNFWTSKPEEFAVEVEKARLTDEPEPPKRKAAEVILD